MITSRGAPPAERTLPLHDLNINLNPQSVGYATKSPTHSPEIFEPIIVRELAQINDCDLNGRLYDLFEPGQLRDDSCSFDFALLRKAQCSATIPPPSRSS